jgi:ParB-like chromosome segregation protein Spo0J
MEITELGLSEIRVSGLNTRKDLQAGNEDSSLADLANSIKEQGLLNPVTVKKNSDGT